MAGFIARQPNGKLCRWSTVVDSITAYDMTEEEYIEYCAERAREEARQTLAHDVRPFSDIIEQYETIEMTGFEIPEINELLSKMGSNFRLPEKIATT